MQKKRDLYVVRYGEVAKVFNKLRNVKVDSSKNIVLNFELLEKEAVALHAILLSQNKQMFFRFHVETKKKMYLKIWKINGCQIRKLKQLGITKC